MSAWRGARVVNDVAPLVRAAISSQRALPSNTPLPKFSVTQNRPLVTPVALLVTGAPTGLPFTPAS